jgi:hypothetical protein
MLRLLFLMSVFIAFVACKASAAYRYSHQSVHCRAAKRSVPSDVQVGAARLRTGSLRESILSVHELVPHPIPVHSHHPLLPHTSPHLPSHSSIAASFAALSLPDFCCFATQPAPRETALLELLNRLPLHSQSLSPPSPRLPSTQHITLLPSTCRASRSSASISESIVIKCALPRQHALSRVSLILPLQASHNSVSALLTSSFSQRAHIADYRQTRYCKHIYDQLSHTASTKSTVTSVTVHIRCRQA